MKRTFSLIVLTLAIVLAAGLAAWAAENGDIALPAGTELVVKLTNTLSNKGSEEGDPWAGKVEEPIFAGGVEVIPPESTVRGHVTFLNPAGRLKGRGEMRLVAETVSTPEHGTFTIVARLNNLDDNKGSKLKDDEGTIEGPGKSAKQAAKEAGIGAAVGAGGGALIDGGKGALFGMAIGAIGGLTHSLAKKHQGVLLPPGTEFTFVLNQTFLSKRVAPPAHTDNSSSE
jgi:hypothetical protein